MNESISSRSVIGLNASGQGIIVFSHLRWNFVWQRPQQFLSRFAKTNPVLFIEEPDFNLKEGMDPMLVMENVSPSITVAHVQFPPSARRSRHLPDQLREYTRAAIELVNVNGQFTRPLLWYYSPMEAAWSLGHFPNCGIVYDCMDELSQFAFAPKQLVRNECKLIEAADIVFTGGYQLWLRKKRQHPNVHFFGCGVEYEHFAQAQERDLEIPRDLQDLPRPIIGWFGVIDERVDYMLLKRAAARRPDWSFVMVGPVVKVDPRSLPTALNLRYLGRRAYEMLPAYCKGFDICMMPFALNKATEYINPTKALEYLATGKPTISTPVRDVVRQYSDVVRIVRNVDDLIQTVCEEMRHPDPERLMKGIERAKACSWENTVSQMQQLISESIAWGPTPLHTKQTGLSGAPMRAPQSLKSPT